MSYRLGAPVHTDHLIKKSRFIGCVQTVRDRAEAVTVVDALRLAHPGAAHVCWALMAGGQSAANDDGEPSGTAGRPMLEVLRHQDLEGVLATVVRYFGGVKLGAGGLVRAYTDAIAQACAVAEKIPHTATSTATWQVGYAHEGAVRRLAQANGVTLSVAHDHETVSVTITAPTQDMAQWHHDLRDITAGQAQCLSAPLVDA